MAQAVFVLITMVEAFVTAQQVNIGAAQLVLLESAMDNIVRLLIGKYNIIINILVLFQFINAK